MRPNAAVHREAEREARGPSRETLVTPEWLSLWGESPLWRTEKSITLAEGRATREGCPRKPECKGRAANRNRIEGSVCGESAQDDDAEGTRQGKAAAVH